MNIWNFTGNLGKDSEVKYLPSGEAICSFSVAVKSGYGDKQKTTWANCAMFGKSASGGLPQYLTQGTQVACSGEVCLDEWQGQDGIKQKTLKVNIIKVDLIGSSQGKNAPHNSQQSATPRAQPQQPVPQQQPVGFDSFDDDIPF